MLTKNIWKAVLLTSSFLFTAVILEASFSLIVLGDFAKDQSESLCRQLSSRGYPVHIVYGENYEVRVGPFETREKAQETLETLEQEEKIVTKIVEEEDFEQNQLFDDEYPNENEGLGKAVNKGTENLYTDKRAKKIVSLGLDLFGHPYKYGGESIGKGIDCSYFVQIIYKELGIDLPRTAREQIKKGTKVSKNKLRVGDLVFFEKTYYSKKKNKNDKRTSYKRINHVGIYIGEGEFIHATINVKHVTISKLSEPYFKKHYAGARRFLNN